MSSKEFDTTEKFDNSRQYVQTHITDEVKKCAPKLMDTLGSLFFKLRDSKALNGINIYLNEGVLAHACCAFFADIFRVEAFHPVLAADDHKKAAHIFKWISRLRPVIPGEEGDPINLKGAAIRANGMFALLCAASFLDTKAFTPLPNERAHIIYSSIYRDIIPQDWAMIFYLLEKIHSVSLPKCS